MEGRIYICVIYDIPTLRLNTIGECVYIIDERSYIYQVPGNIGEKHLKILKSKDNP